MKSFARSLRVAPWVLATWACSTALAQPGMPAAESSCVLVQNVQLFDGVQDRLRRANVLVQGSKIGRIQEGPLTPPASCEVIDGGGRVLMPGLTDAHWHLMMAATPPQDLQHADPGLMYAHAVAEAQRTLMRGFTTVRDMAGPTFGLKDAIDYGVIPGPRVYPSGALISQTSGHGDFAPPYEAPKVLGGPRSYSEMLGAFTVADGVPEVLGAVRAELKKGASQVKLAAGGGVISFFDPLDSTQFTPEELRAAVQAARDWGTYVAVHVYTSEGIRRALEAGVLSIEHGHLADEETIKRIAAKGAWLSMQPFEANDEPLSPEAFEKSKPLFGAWERVLRWAKKYKVKVAFGTDLLFSQEVAGKENLMLTRLAKVYTNVELLKMATSGNCALFALSGPQNPYKEARLGVLEEGAWADMLLVDGDPTRDIQLLADPDKNLVVIIKNGWIYKNLLRR